MSPAAVTNCGALALMPSDTADALLPPVLAGGTYSALPLVMEKLMSADPVS